MIWLAVFPTLTIINLVFADWLGMLPTVLRTFVLATVAVPIVIYAIMPQLHRIRGRLLARAARRQQTPGPGDQGDPQVNMTSPRQEG